MSSLSYSLAGDTRGGLDIFQVNYDQICLHDALTRMEQPRQATLQLLALGPVSANGPKDVSKKETSHREWRWRKAPFFFGGVFGAGVNKRSANRQVDDPFIRSCLQSCQDVDCVFLLYNSLAKPQMNPSYGQLVRIGHVNMAQFTKIMVSPKVAREKNPKSFSPKVEPAQVESAWSS